MMCLTQKIVLLLLIADVCSKKENFRSHSRTQEKKLKSNQDDRNQGSSEEEDGTNLYSARNASRAHTTNTKPKQDAIVEKFVESLVSSEKYYKIMETMERRLRHLEISFDERTNTLAKYILEILQLVKSSPSEVMEVALRSMKADLDKLRTAIVKQSTHPNMRLDGHEYHGDIDTRMTIMEGNIKTVLAGVESIHNTIAEVKNRQYSRTFVKSEGGMPAAADALNLINEFRRTLHEQKTRKCDCKSGRFDRAERYPTDCREIQMQGFNASGIYKIKPEDMDPFYVLCDLITSGGGWTVIQNRFDGSQDFYKGWSDYKHGFGNLAGEFWLGLEKLNYLTNQKLYELRIEMETQHGQEAYAGYSVFTVGPEHEGYRISTLGTYFGTAGDSLTYHAGQKFSSLDMDNDEWKDGACATEHGGAWWYKECDKSNLNGRYTMSSEEHRGQSIYWISFKGPNSPLSKTKMMIRPLPASKPVDYTDSLKRKIVDTNKLRSPHESSSNTRAKEKKTAYDIGRAPYRYEEPTHADAFFPNYA
ncbi:unnamed protein product [Chilo suppressalis]|uniref:Fibrinogen C-terminal domain-containing protein n=1 Tax=Chilo suppressalis TaxID=168631 RepID=A0ABN8B532_CHISP|nr:unnamed protein product [Chilo suppressalis]